MVLFRKKLVLFGGFQDNNRSTPKYFNDVYVVTSQQERFIGCRFGFHFQPQLISTCIFLFKTFVFEGQLSTSDSPPLFFCITTQVLVRSRNVHLDEIGVSSDDAQARSKIRMPTCAFIIMDQSLTTHLS